MPLAAHAVLDGGVLSLRAAWGEPEGATELVRASAQTTALDLASADQLGLQVAALLRAGGAR
jgi:hydroxymethylbilane synthase